MVRSERSFDFALVSEFADRQSLERYQKHPEHLVTADKIKKLCTHLLAVDFFTGRNRG